MFIKIRNNPENRSDEDSFTIIDNIKTVRFFKPAPIKVTSKERLLQLSIDSMAEGVELNFEAINKILDSKEAVLDEDNPYLLNQINFVLKDGDEQGEDWIFDTVAYLCDDSGKTIEKSLGGGARTNALWNLVNK